MIFSKRFRLKLINYKNLHRIYTHRRQKDITFFNQLITDLVQSAFITLALYFLIFVLFYVLIDLNNLNDPSQSVKCSSESSKNKTVTQDLVKLATIIDIILSKTNEKYFICYQSLIYLLNNKTSYIYEQNRLDLCLYDTRMSLSSVLNSLHYQFGDSKLEYILKEFRKSLNKDFSYETNRLYGVYEFKYKTARLYLYLFANLPESRLEFESITRTGILYTQFSQLIDYFYRRDNLTKLERIKSISVLNRLPIYLVDEMNYKVKLANSYFWIPVDPFNSIMYFYPGIWWKSNDKNCKFN